MCVYGEYCSIAAHKRLQKPRSSEACYHGSVFSAYFGVTKGEDPGKARMQRSFTHLPGPANISGHVCLDPPTYLATAVPAFRLHPLPPPSTQCPELYKSRHGLVTQVATHRVELLYPGWPSMICENRHEQQQRGQGAT